MKCWVIVHVRIHCGVSGVPMFQDDRPSQEEAEKALGYRVEDAGASIVMFGPFEVPSDYDQAFEDGYHSTYAEWKEAQEKKQKREKSDPPELVQDCKCATWAYYVEMGEWKPGAHHPACPEGNE